jgi:hypothetical protein
MLAGLVSTAAPRALGAPEKGRDACFEAAEQAQLLTNAGRLRASRPHLLICTREQCPSQMRRDCGRWLADADAALATVVLEAHDSKDQSLTDVRVEVDGEMLVARIDGIPVEIDPGQHTFTFVLPSGVRVEQQVTILGGERAKRLSVVLESPDQHSTRPDTRPSSPSPSTRSISLVAYIAGGVAISAGGIGSYFALTGLERENSLRSSCGTRCADDDVDSLRQKYRFADVFFGIAVVAAAATVWVVTRPTRSAARLGN